MSNVKVVVRIRPLIQREIQNNEVEVIQQIQNTAILRESMNQEFDDPSLYVTHQFTFDRIFSQKSTQDDVYNECVRELVDNFLEGYNGCILAYGQTSSGKTYTIMSTSFEGVVPHAIQHIFEYLSDFSQDKYILRASYFQIYNENVLDLLNPNQINLRIRETTEQQIYVENLTYYQLFSPQDLIDLLDRGSQNRVQAETKLNTNSSRSHSILTIYLDNQEQQTSSKLQILDLAGSERINSNIKQRQTETKHINQSLAVLGNVMQQIVQFQRNSNSNTHINFRDSKLTRILQDSVGGNCKTLLITCISPSSACFYETLNSLKFADRAKQIKQHAVVNEVENLNVEVEVEKLKVQIQEMIEKIKQAQEEGGCSNGDGNNSSANNQTIEQLNQQIANYEKIINSDSFTQLKDIYNQLQQFEQLKSDSQDQINDINQLRNQSLKYRDFLIILTDKLQSKEEAVKKIEYEIQTIRESNIAMQQQRLADGTNLQEQLGNSIVLAQSQQVLDYNEKYDELVNLKDEFSKQNQQLQEEFTKLETQISMEKQKLEQRVRTLLDSNAACQDENERIHITLSECIEERRLLINIFQNKLIQSVQQIQANGDQNSIQNLKSFVTQILNAVEQGDLRKKMQKLFE